MSTATALAAPPAVIVAGDALVDLTPAVTISATPAYEPHPGGSCLNVAVGLGRLGVPVSLLARVSDDHFGDLLRAHLADSGTLPTYLLPTSDPSALAAVHLHDNGSVGYSFYAAGAADRGLRPEHLAELPDGGRLPDGAALHLGSIALLQEPQASTLDMLLRRESRRRLVSLDPNVRPGLVTDRTSYLRRIAEWVALADLVKASDEDLAWLYPGEPYEKVAERWLTAGAGLVLVTFGTRGAWAANRTAHLHVPTPAVEVVDTVGAGDAFTAGVLAHLYRTGRLTREGVTDLGTTELGRLLSYAVEIASDTCTRAGAQPPYRDGSAVPASAVPVQASVAELVERARALVCRGGRRILGIAGAPAAGKSTLARHLVEALGPDLAVLVPMDGFHLSNAALRALGRRDRKGAWDTFDADGYLHLLRRLRSSDEPIVYAPDFDREIDESIGSALPVPREVPLVVTEGNYLLSGEGPWGKAAGFLDEGWYLEIDDDIRWQRLTARHMSHGMPHDLAVAWTHGSDQTNAELVSADRARADLVVTVTAAEPRQGPGSTVTTPLGVQPPGEEGR